MSPLPKPDVWPTEMTVKDLFRYGLWTDIIVTYQSDTVETLALDTDGYKVFGPAWDDLGLVLPYDTLIQISPTGSVMNIMSAPDPQTAPRVYSLYSLKKEEVNKQANKYRYINQLTRNSTKAWDINFYRKTNGSSEMYYAATAKGEVILTNNYTPPVVYNFINNIKNGNSIKGLTPIPLVTYKPPPGTKTPNPVTQPMETIHMMENPEPERESLSEIWMSKHQPNFERQFGRATTQPSMSQPHD